MKGNHLGEFEELVLLTVASLAQDAYAVTIREGFNEATNRNITISAIHAALYRLEDKGFLTSEFKGATPVRGGKRKRCFLVTNAGYAILQQNKLVRESLWKTIPRLSFSGL